MSRHANSRQFMFRESTWPLRAKLKVEIVAKQSKYLDLRVDKCLDCDLENKTSLHG